MGLDWSGDPRGCVSLYLYHNSSKSLEDIDSNDHYRSWFYTDVNDYVKGVCERQNNEYCNRVLVEVESAYELMLKLSRKVGTGANIIGQSGSFINLNGKRSTDTFHPSDPYDMELLRTIHNYTMDSHEMIDNPRIGARSEDGTPALAHHYRLNGVRAKDSNVSRTYDIYHFEDGNAHLRIPGPGSGSESGLSKRHDGPGVKIAFTHEPISYPANDFVGAGANFAYRWRNYAIKGHGEIFGWAGTSGQAFMYYRSIVEGAGFGNNYESVNACGDLSSHVGTYVGH